MSETSPVHAESWKSRACPGVRGFCSSFALRTTNGRTLIRRISMWTILMLRITVSIGLVTRRFFGDRLLGLILGIVLVVLNLVFITWCLAMIDRAEGYRHVFCIRVGRNHLDIFLAVMAVLHIALVCLVFLNPWVASLATLTNVSWFTLWALIAVYGFISSRTAAAAA